MTIRNCLFSILSLYTMYGVVAWPSDLIPIRAHFHIFVTALFFFIGVFFSLSIVWNAIKWMFTDSKEEKNSN